MRRQLWAIALGAFLWLPVAAASNGQGDFATVGFAAFPNGTEATFSPVALFAGDAAQLHGSLSVPVLRVWAFERQDFRVEPGLIPAVQMQNGRLQERSFILHDAQVSFSPGPGFVGLYPMPSGRLDFYASGAMRAEPQSASIVPAGNPGTDAPNLPVYHMEIKGSHFSMEAPGRADYSGSAALKAVGPRVQITARENSTDYQTGVEQDSTVGITTRWLYVEWDEGMLSLDAAAPFEIAAPGPVAFGCDGTLVFTPTSGELATDHGRFAPKKGSRAQVTGTLEGALSTAQAGQGARLTFTGDVRSTNFYAQSVPLPQNPGGLGLPWGWLGLAAMGIVGTVGAAVIVRHRRTPPREAPTLYFTHYAFVADERGDFAVALAWVQAAREIAPKDADLAMWEATLHVNLGHLEDALTDYSAASRLSPGDGEPDYWAAILLAKRAEANDHDRALECLERSLRRDPSRAGTIERDALFAPLRGPDFTAMLRDAWDRLGARDIHDLNWR